jgi:dienelactone hydrolase
MVLVIGHDAIASRVLAGRHENNPDVDVDMPALSGGQGVVGEPLASAGDSVRHVTDVLGVDGQSVTADRFEPVAAGNHPGVVLLHGLDGMYETAPLYHETARHLARNGMVVVIPHFFERTGTSRDHRGELKAHFERRLKSAGEDGGELQRTFDLWAATGKAAVRHVQGLGNVDPTRTAILGFSMGGFLASTIAAEADSNLSAVVVLFGGLPPRHAGAPRMPPTLIIHGDRDQVVPVGEAHRLRDLLLAGNRPVEIKVYEGVGHVFLEGGLKARLAAWDAWNRAAAFLQANLGVGAASGAGSPAG